MESKIKELESIIKSLKREVKDKDSKIDKLEKIISVLEKD